MSGLDDSGREMGNNNNEMVNDKESGRKCCRYGCRFWCKKYFWEGQELTTSDGGYSQEQLDLMPSNKRFLVKYRRLIGFAIPVTIWHFFWWALFFDRGFWKEQYFPTKYHLSITMIAGGTVAGMTSVGGGAVAFPVLTLVLRVPPDIARDVALMIQSSGMTAASFSIFFMRVCVEWHALILCTVGSLAGIIFGLHVVDPAMSSSLKKLTFVSIWLSFAIVLLILNRTHKRRTFNGIPAFGAWKGAVLVIGGFVGGIFTAFAGTGLDICAFMVLTLLFRISEKVATPTTVILMAFNSLIALYWRANMLQAVTDTAWQYIAVTFPVVTIMAPVGSIIGTHFHRLVLAALVIILNVTSYILAFVIVRPLTFPVVGTSIGIMVGCFLVFIAMTYAGQKLLDRYESSEDPNGDKERRIAILSKIFDESHINLGYRRDNSSLEL
ncbi:hypothetical protein LSH36_395g02037 [Paralvinella palmiformis]|uniref:Membrane transporter protein n=1 Tax=Paralvinella palmiformis TaxID=53620 RepID=A0AAD9JCK6_9ANNE|nr:hypothetical protein LSH36_395g02037 [Paralvinella palmiformis]